MWLCGKARESKLRNRKILGSHPCPNKKCCYLTSLQIFFQFFSTMGVIFNHHFLLTDKILYDASIATTLRTMALSITTFDIMDLIVLCYVVMLIIPFLYCCVEYRYAECHSAECHYAEYRYAECHYAECHYAEYHYAE